MSNMWNKLGWKVLGLTLALAISGNLAVKADEPYGCTFGGCSTGGCSTGGCSTGHCQLFHCPHTKFCLEGPPCICVIQGCAKPVINPCTQPFWGYYQTCWSPWPGGPDWSHCPVQPPASLVFPPPGAQLPPGTPLQNSAPPREPAGTLPYPRMIQQP